MARVCFPFTKAYISNSSITRCKNELKLPSSAMGTKSNTGRWIRGAIIGAGAFGTVSLAINNSNGELFAVKSALGDSVSCLENVGTLFLV